MKRRRIVDDKGEKQYFKSLLDILKLTKSDKICLLSQFDSNPPNKGETYFDWINKILNESNKNPSGFI